MRARKCSGLNTRLNKNSTMNKIATIFQPEPLFWRVCTTMGCDNSGGGTCAAGLGGGGTDALWPLGFSGDAGGNSSIARGTYRTERTCRKQESILSTAAAESSSQRHSGVI